MMPYTEVLFKPGSRFSYSNPGVIYLGRIIELLSHDDYEVYVDKNIFKSLEMHRSYFDSTPTTSSHTARTATTCAKARGRRRGSTPTQASRSRTGASTPRCPTWSGTSTSCWATRRNR